MTAIANQPTFNRYMLRKALPPWKFQETLDEVTDFCRENGVGEVIWMIDAEDHSRGLATLDYLRQFVPWLTKSHEQLAKVGTVMSINPWVTQGMRDAGWDLRGVFPDFEWLTDITGVQAKSQACPMSPAWREWFFSCYEMYASTGPRVLWIEDDFRVHRHRPVLTACFCKRHIETFCKKIGRPFTRESLAAEILRPGEPSPLRAQWLEHVGSNMSEVVELLAQRIYSKFPQVQLGLMCNSPAMNAMDRRDWDRIMRALNGPHPRGIIRPPMCEYQATDPMVLFDARQHVAGILKCVRTPVEACSEIDNCRYSLYAKSMRLTRAQLLLSAACGCPSATLAVFDYTGTPISDDPEVGPMLREVRPMLDQMVPAFAPGGVDRGVGILHDEFGPNFTHLKQGQGFHDMSQGRETMGYVAQTLGMPITFEKSPVIAVSGQKLRGFADRIDEFFSGGVLLDLSALETLISMGRGDLAGVKLLGTFQRRERQTSMEAMTDPEFGGATHRHVTIDTGGLLVRIGQFEPLPGARVISNLIDGDLRPLMPGFVLYENSLGGRVAVCPYDLNDHFEQESRVPIWFINPRRRAQIAAIVSWLFRGKLPLDAAGGVFPVAIRKDYADRVMVFVLNASLDDWQSVELKLDMDRPVRSVKWLDHRGSWHDLPGNRFALKDGVLRVSSDVPLETCDAAVFKIQQ